MKPLIGITCNYSTQDTPGIIMKMGVLNQTWQMLASNYVDSIVNAGGIPILIPISENFESLEELVDRLDGIIISGGNDINPNLYNEFISKEVGTISPKRDKQEFEIVKYVLEKTSKPLLGICRGIQVLNVVCGGNLYQDLEKVGLNNHFIDSSPLNYGIHKVNIEKNSILYNIFEKDTIKVNSFHHQAIKTLGKNLKCIAKSQDGVIEAIYMEGNRFILGTQWHPEMMFDSLRNQNIFKKFVAECHK